MAESITCVRRWIQVYISICVDVECCVLRRQGRGLVGVSQVVDISPLSTHVSTHTPIYPCTYRYQGRLFPELGRELDAVCMYVCDRKIGRC